MSSLARSRFYLVHLGLHEARTWGFCWRCLDVLIPRSDLRPFAGILGYCVLKEISVAGLIASSRGRESSSCRDARRYWRSFASFSRVRGSTGYYAPALLQGSPLIDSCNVVEYTGSRRHPILSFLTSTGMQSKAGVHMGSSVRADPSCVRSINTRARGRSHSRS